MSDPAVETFIARWQGREGGQERANYALFLSELCAVIGVGPPDPAGADTDGNDYVFERAVREPNGNGTFGHRRIDLYKRGCFLLEAKQSRQRGGKKEVAGHHDLFGAGEPPARGRRTAGRAWDVLMMNARQQAEAYARCLPPGHGWPPFILVCDVGHCLELYADFSGQGRNYAQFPDRRGFRVYLEDLREPEIRDWLRRVWTDPRSLDPARKSVGLLVAHARNLHQGEGAGLGEEEEVLGHKGILKTEMKRRSLTYELLAEKLGEIGVQASAPVLRTKVNRGGFSAVFFVQCLRAMGVKDLRLSEG
jgi:hypothetical protein